jgi:hypothetical protein
LPFRYDDISLTTYPHRVLLMAIADVETSRIDVAAARIPTP